MSRKNESNRDRRITSALADDSDLQLGPRHTTVLLIMSTLAAAGLSVLGCQSDESACDSCATKYAHMCYDDTFLGRACSDDIDQDAACAAVYPEAMNPTGVNVPCTDIPLGTTAEFNDGDADADETDDYCEAWDPSAAISFGNGVYEVDSSWFTAVVTDTRPLALCDDAEVAYFSYGSPPTVEGYQVSNASTSDALYQLGLRNNEVVTKINGSTVTSFDDAAQLLWDLYFDQGETDYEVTIDCVSGCSSTGRSYPTTIDISLI